MYFGVQNGDSCYCGNDDSKFIPVAKEECNQPCSGDETQICGAMWRLNVYENDSITEDREYFQLCRQTLRK